MYCAILNLLKELTMPALQEERFLEYHGKMLKGQENGPMNKTVRHTEIT